MDAFTTIGALGGYFSYDNTRLVSNSGVTSYANSNSNGFEVGGLMQVVSFVRSAVHTIGQASHYIKYVYN